MTSEILVEAVGLTHAYTTGRVKTKVLHGIDLSIRSGTNVFLTGDSGSGKTTLISLIGCLRSVQSGSLAAIRHLSEEDDCTTVFSCQNRAYSAIQSPAA